MERAMKDSGIEWIKEIPIDWKVSKIGQKYSIRATKVSDKDYEPLSVTYGGVVPQLENVAKTDAHDDRKLVKKGDFAINSRSDRRGACGIADRNGSVSLINIVLRPHDDMVAKYYEFLFHSVQFGDEFYKWGHGIVDDLWTTGWRDMKKMSIPVPPLAEQQAIADYLNKKTAEIDAAIGEAKGVIEKYKAYKQSVITEAVTKGLRKGVRMKESGVEWIGEIPEDWGTNKFKIVYKLGKGLSITKADLVEAGLSVISYGQIHSKANNGTTVKDELIRFVPDTYLRIGYNSILSVGDVIFADTSEDLNGCGNCLYIDRDRLIFGGYHTIIAKNIESNKNKYLPYLFQTDCWRSQIRSVVNGVKLYSIPQRILSSTSILVPPLGEQQEIAEYLDVKCAAIDEIVVQKERLISKLQEYKRSIIFEYVTGKREVKSGNQRG